MGRFFINYINKKIGELTVIRLVEGQASGDKCKYLHEVKCSCGLLEIRPLYSLLNAQRLGRFVACKKCVVIRNRTLGPRTSSYNLDGQRFGSLNILGYSHREWEGNYKGVWWDVQCDCGALEKRCGHRLIAAKELGHFIGCRSCYLKQIEIASKEKEKQITFNPNLPIIDGLMLGDGCLTRGADYNATLHIGQTDKGLTEFIRDKLKPGHSIKEYIPKVLGRKKVYSFCFSHSFLLPIYKRWYLDGKKIVPVDLNLTPETVLHWFMGDGSTQYQRGNRSVSLILSTNSFTEQEVNILADKLSVVVGERARVSTQKSPKKLPDGSLRTGPEKTYWRITNGGAAFIKAFFNYIGECPVPDMAYKWKLPTLIRTQNRSTQVNPASGLYGVYGKTYTRDGSFYWRAHIRVHGKMLAKENKDKEVVARWRDNIIIVNGLQGVYPLNFLA